VRVSESTRLGGEEEKVAHDEDGGVVNIHCRYGSIQPCRQGCIKGSHARFRDTKAV